MAYEIGQVRQTGAYNEYADGQERPARLNRRAELVTQATIQQWVADGRVFTVNSGTGTAPATFAGAYVATTPDVYVYVPLGTTLIPLKIRVMYEAVGTESTMEIVATASVTGDSTAGGTALTIYPYRLDNPRASVVTATAGGTVTSPNSGIFFDFWRKMRPLTDTVATTENDRHELVFEWSALTDIPPYIVGTTAGTGGSCLALWAASQAGTGFIEVTWAEIPSTSAV
mgnify:CR=1 FL=1